TRWTHMKITSNTLGQSAYTTLDLLSYESERKDRLEGIEEREHADLLRHFPIDPKTGRIPNGAMAQWLVSPEHAKYEAERDAVAKWFRAALADQVKRAQTGQ